ncbi:hypothetical protein HG66A1_04760 [Gimesia chilikensis]|uniref:Uncharacterized protein n=1 Tax=Gimesia chilikensis TaxID=2605989 RepID=A0A517PH71_9PLAN|nr:hypothetical protein HG66A1_04760 [Gimesia chilikensis]
MAANRFLKNSSSPLQNVNVKIVVAEGVSFHLILQLMLSRCFSEATALS